MAKALENIKVLEFGHFFSGPFCTMLLKDLGAEVIKVEIPGAGEAARGAPPLTEGLESPIFITNNRGKKGVTLNLKSERGIQIARELAKRVDVLVENLAPGSMDRLGLGYEEFAKINPGLIYASISGFGQTGPRRSEPVFDMVAQAMGGLISITGFPDSPPIKVGASIADFLSGLYTTISILAALHYRAETGEGQLVDISMQDCIWSITAIEHAANYFLNNQIPERLGNGLPQVLPFNIYQAKDGYIVICVSTVGQWESLLRVIGRYDLIGLEKYTTLVERVKNREEVDALVEEWTKTNNVNEMLNQLRKAQVPCSPVPKFDQVAKDPQLLSREMIIEVEQTVSGKVKMPGSVFKLSKTPGDVNFPAPFLGEHNYEIYSKLLGYSEQEINKLADEAII